MEFPEESDWEELDEWEEDDLYKACEKCDDEGIEGGCPICGMWPMFPNKTVEGIEYYFVTNTKIGDETHKAYEDLKKNNKARILFEDAITRFHKPLPDHIAIWLATADREIVRQEGVYT